MKFIANSLLDIDGQRTYPGCCVELDADTVAPLVACGFIYPDPDDVGEDEADEQPAAEDEAVEQPAAEDAVTGHLDPAQLESMTAADLRKMADDMGIKGAKGKNKAQLIAEICAQEVSVAAKDATASPDDL